MNQPAAIRFVRERGNPSEQARLAFLLTGTMPSSESMQQFFQDQQEDGGWSPFWAPGYRGLDATCFCLAQGEQMGIGLNEPNMVQAALFLAQRQHSDGAFEEDEAVSDLAPPWARPGNLAAQLYLTANCGFWLTFFPQTRASAQLAARYIHSFLPPNGHLPTFLHTHWLAAGLFSHLKQIEPAKCLLAYLANRLPDLSASSLAWLMVTLRLANWPATTPLIAQAAALLNQLQQPAGNWQSEDGPEQDVHATLEALRAFMFL
ncbi:hypothetical protein [Ktedonospora formicarum]|uniref:Squalene cyclase C-terminal domain-containing protein n=1 Tax=Ktedonospora formicarum TaxID=2778364 RepID=A0A8J3IB56_9CHLR|nr:hypothetical protein [Ktedonospora formicarum]GHO48844.1 hypothetical protein KSX_70070 [Ktedonospora formicarum]